MIKKLGLTALLLSSPSLQASTSPLVPPALYAALRFHNPLSAAASIGYLWYKFIQLFLEIPYQLPSPAPVVADPTITVFAFDLHDVMFKPNYHQRMSAVIKSPYLWTAIKHFINPRFMYDFLKLATQQLAAEQIMNTLFKKYAELRPLENTIYDIINALTPIEGTINLIQSLKEQGFKIYLLSNIGDQVLKDLMTKYPIIFSYFDGFFYTAPEHNYIRKPHAHYYEEFFKKFNVQPDHIVFVDDLKKNIYTANKLGMHGIVFNCPQQLVQELQKMNFAVAR